MKKLLVALFWVLFGAGCKTQIVEKIILPCDCKDAPISSGHIAVTGLILFPNFPIEVYSLYILIPPPLDFSPIFPICSDSTFTRLLKEQKIADSSKVYIDKWGGLVSNDITCKSKRTPNSYPVRILAMKKLP